MPSWKNYDREQKKRADKIFIKIALDEGMITQEEVHKGLQRQENLAKCGQELAMGQVLLKMRALKIEDFMVINRRLKETTIICQACTTIQFAGDSPHHECEVCGYEVEREEPQLARSTEMMGAYELLEKIAQGGMGVVYRARHNHLNRIVALKVLHGDMEENLQMTRRFRREWETASSLHHKNIVEVRDAGIVEGKHFFTMDYIEGAPLSEMISEGGMEPRRALEIVRQLALALDYAHSQQVIHRDIKPANILLDEEGIPHITDFGIAKALNRNTQLTKTGMAVGTLYYMSPEQALGKSSQVDPRSDIYSLGVVLYQMLSGQVPFGGETYMEVLNKIKEAEPPPLSRNIEGVDQGLEKICFRAMAKDKERRYSSGQEMARDIDRYLRGERPQALVEARREKIGPLLVRVGVALAVILLALGIWWSGFFTPSKEKRNQKKDTQKKGEEDLPRDEETRRQYLIAGSSFLYVGKNYQARSYFKKALEIGGSKKESDLYFLKGLASQILDQRLEAKSAYNKALKIDSSLAMAYFARASISALLGEEKEAQKDWEKAYSLHSDFPPPIKDLTPLIKWDEKLGRKGIYWSLKERKVYFQGRGPQWKEKKQTYRTPHYHWTIYYRPEYEIKWTYDFGEKIYSKIKDYTGLKPFLPAFQIRIDRGKYGRLGYTETRFGEIRFFAGNWLAHHGCMELFLQTVTTQFLFSTISADWPVDWWESEYGTFQALLAVKILRDLEEEEVASRLHQRHLANPLYRLFLKWTKENGWKLWKEFFRLMKQEGINFYEMARRHPWKLRSAYIAVYLSLVLDRNVALQLQKAGLGEKPPWWKDKWPRRNFKAYQISPSLVEKIQKVRDNLEKFKLAGVKKKSKKMLQTAEKASELFGQGNWKEANRMIEN